MKQSIFRFAPSPNGELHLGHAMSALINQRLAKKFSGKLILRFDDNDRGRWRTQYETQILEDLAWLGVEFDGEPTRISDHFSSIGEALTDLETKGLCYHARLSRRAVRGFQAEYDAGHSESWPIDPDGTPLYPRIIDNHLSGPAAVRLDANSLAVRLGSTIVNWRGFGSQIVEQDFTEWGDALLRSKSDDYSYLLATVMCDHEMGVSHIVRGQDIYPNTSLQNALQKVLDLDTPVYHHHPLILGDSGEKLSKSAGAQSLKALRKSGVSKQEVLDRLEPYLALYDCDLEVA